MATKGASLEPLNRQSLTLRSLYTAVIFYGQFSTGLIIGIMGPSIVDFRYLLGDASHKEALSMSSLTLYFTFLISGSALGSSVSFTYKGIFLSPYLNRQLVTGFLAILAGTCLGVTVRINSLPLFYLLSVLTGFGAGNLGTVAETWLIEMWTGRPLAAVSQALQLSYGLGSIIGPLLVRPHLHGYMNSTQVKEMNLTLYQKVIEERRDSLITPFTIVGCILALVGVTHLILYSTVCLRYRLPSEVSIASPESTTSSVKLFESPRTRPQLFLFLTLILLIIAGNNCAEIVYMTFQETFLQSLSSFAVSAGEAAAIASITATSYTVGRAVSILISTVLSAGNMLLLHYGLALTGFISLLFTTRTSLTLIRINSALIGYSFSAIKPAMFIFTNTYSICDDRRNGMFSLALTIPSIFTPLLIGHFIEAVPSVLIYIVLSVLPLSVLCFATARFWLVRRTEASLKATRKLSIESSNVLK